MVFWNQRILVHRAMENCCRQTEEGCLSLGLWVRPTSCCRLDVLTQPVEQCECDLKFCLYEIFKKVPTSQASVSDHLKWGSQTRWGHRMRIALIFMTTSPHSHGLVPILSYRIRCHCLWCVHVHTLWEHAPEVCACGGQVTTWGSPFSPSNSLSLGLSCFCWPAHPRLASLPGKFSCLSLPSWGWNAEIKNLLLHFFSFQQWFKSGYELVQQMLQPTLRHFSGPLKWF